MIDPRVTVNRIGHMIHAITDSYGCMAAKIGQSCHSFRAETHGGAGSDPSRRSRKRSRS